MIYLLNLSPIRQLLAVNATELLLLHLQIKGYLSMLVIDVVSKHHMCFPPLSTFIFPLVLWKIGLRKEAFRLAWDPVFWVLCLTCVSSSIWTCPESLSCNQGQRLYPNTGFGVIELFYLIFNLISSMGVLVSLWLLWRSVVCSSGMNSFIKINIGMIHNLGHYKIMILSGFINHPYCFLLFMMS